MPDIDPPHVDVPLPIIDPPHDDGDLPRVPTVNLDRSPEALLPGQDAKVTWENRRLMAWLCLSAMFIVVAYCSLWIPLDRFEKIDNFLENFLWVCFAVVSVYMGTTAIPALYTMRGRR